MEKLLVSEGTVLTCSECLCYIKEGQRYYEIDDETGPVNIHEDCR